jgi:hypothetical protein
VENAEEETAGHGVTCLEVLLRPDDFIDAVMMSFCASLFSTNMREEKIKHEQPEENRGHVLDSCHGIFNANGAFHARDPSSSAGYDSNGFDSRGSQDGS